MKIALALLLASVSSVSVSRGAAQTPMAPAPLHVQVAAPQDAPGRERSDTSRKPRLPSFAPELADMQRISGPKGWGTTTRQQALAALGRSRPATRQRARWGYATSLIAEERYADALGVLEVMLADDRDLALVANFQLAQGVVYAALNRTTEALAALEREELGSNAEACFWRTRIRVQLNMTQDALREIGCARAAAVALASADRVPFLIDVAEAALAEGQPKLALSWLAAAPDGDAAANLMRGRVHLALKEFGEARIRLGRAERAGNDAQRYDAQLTLVEMAAAQGTMTVEEARRKVDHIRFVWRGGPVEERALRLGYSLAKRAGDTRGALSAGATLIRYFDLGPNLPGLLAEVQAQLAALLAPENRMPLAEAAGLFWEYRDLAPAGGEGDRLVVRLADRLQGEGLYARAAELLEHQLRHRALDVAQGPLSVRVATLHILAGRPDRALAAVRDTEGTVFPQPMLWDRARIHAVALYQDGKSEEALAVLDGVPNANGLRAELLWKRRDWGRLVAEVEAELPGQGALSEVKQAVVLRHAIALGMLGREAELAKLRSRYATGFAGLSTAPVFEMLTGGSGNVDPASLTRAMSAIPSASPAGQFADLLALEPSAERQG